MTKSYFVKFGPISAQIKFEPELSHIAEITRKWLSAGLTPEIEEPDIIFLLTPSFPETGGLHNKLSAGNGWLNNNSFGCWDGRGWENCIRRESATNKKTTLSWECKPKNNIILKIAKRSPSTLIRLAHQHYFSYPEMLASTFIYRQIIPAIQIMLLEHNATLIHSSALNHSGGLGVIVSGWGGSGKTSASSYLYLTKPDDWQYMSDDLAILDADGNIYYSPIPLNIFPYNTQQFPKLEKVIIGKMQGLEKIHWRIRERFFGPKSVARRTAPLIETVKTTQTKLGLAIHLQRFSGKSPQINTRTAHELAVVAKNILSYELRHGWQAYLLSNAFSSESTAILPSPDIIAASSEKVLTSAMSKAQTFSVNIPKNYEPEKVSAVVEQLANKLTS